LHKYLQQQKSYFRGFAARHLDELDEKELHSYDRIINVNILLTVLVVELQGLFALEWSAHGMGLVLLLHRLLFFDDI
jgi:hypothetical protein